MGACRARRPYPCHPERSGEGKAKAAQSNGSHQNVECKVEDELRKCFNLSIILHSKFYIFLSYFSLRLRSLQDPSAWLLAMLAPSVGMTEGELSPLRG